MNSTQSYGDINRDVGPCCPCRLAAPAAPPCCPQHLPGRPSPALHRGPLLPGPCLTPAAWPLLPGPCCLAAPCGARPALPAPPAPPDPPDPSPPSPPSPPPTSGGRQRPGAQAARALGDQVRQRGGRDDPGGQRCRAACARRVEAELPAAAAQCAACRLQNTGHPRPAAGAPGARCSGFLPSQVAGEWGRRAPSRPPRPRWATSRPSATPASSASTAPSATSARSSARSSATAVSWAPTSR
jgi:hypothetical protein